MADFVITQHDDIATATDGSQLAMEYGRGIDDTADATDEGIRAADSVRGVDDTALATDTSVRAASSVRGINDTALVTDTLIENDDTSRRFADTAAVTDQFVLSSGTGKKVVDTVVVGADQVIVNWVVGGVAPRRVHLRHIAGQPAYVAWHREQVDTPALLLRQGREESVLAQQFEAMVGERQRIAHMMTRGVLAVAEDYLGSTRALMPYQVGNYTAQSSPWITWVNHRTLTGAPVVLEATGPRATQLGIYGEGFTRILVRAAITGAAGDVTITPWYRNLTETSRGPWTFGADVVGVIDSQEFALDVWNREVYLQVSDVHNAPTAVTLDISGTASA